MIFNMISGSSSKKSKEFAFSYTGSFETITDSEGKCIGMVATTAGILTTTQNYVMDVFLCGKGGEVRSVSGSCITHGGYGARTMNYDNVAINKNTSYEFTINGNHYKIGDTMSSENGEATAPDLTARDCRTEYINGANGVDGVYPWDDRTGYGGWLAKKYGSAGCGGGSYNWNGGLESRQGYCPYGTGDTGSGGSAGKQSVGNGTTPPSNCGGGANGKGIYYVETGVVMQGTDSSPADGCWILVLEDK